MQLSALKHRGMLLMNTVAAFRTSYLSKILYMYDLIARLVLLIVQLMRCVMRIVSFTEARNGLKSVLDRVVNDVDYTVITRRDAEDAVVMSMDHYNSLMETVHLLKSPANAAHLSRSIEQYNSGKIVLRDIIDD
jgi:antitoxin YefM